MVSEKTHECKKIPEAQRIWFNEEDKEWYLIYDDEKDMTFIPIQYCPYCGKKLKESKYKPGDIVEVHTPGKPTTYREY